MLKKTKVGTQFELAALMFNDQGHQIGMVATLKARAAS
jgi:hypothetical protein